MTPHDINVWLKAMPFQPFRVTMAGGRTFDVRHPELLVVFRGSVMLIHPSKEEGVAEKAEMFGLVLFEHIQPIAQTAAAGA